MKRTDYFTLTLITTTGEHHPIGIGGAPKFHVFHDWTHAHGAIADAVATIGRERVLTIARSTSVRMGARVEFNVTHLTRDHIEELCKSSPYAQAHRTTRSDGRSVRVSVPVDDHGDPSPSDGQL